MTRLWDEDRRFAAKVALFSALGYAYTVVMPTYVDARLHNHVVAQYRSRVYPWGYWVLLGVPVVLLATWWIIRAAKSTWWRYGAPVIPLVGAGLVVVWNFRPEFPHPAIVGSLTLYSLLGLLTCWIRWSADDMRAISNLRIPFEARLERVRESISFWTTVGMSVGIAYLAILIPWMQFLSNEVAANVTTDPAEQLLLGSCGVHGVWFYSLCVFWGPIWEASRRRMAAAHHLLSLRCNRAAEEMADHGPDGLM